MATPDASSETQLLAEHFGYPPVSLLDDIINSINLVAQQALDSVERSLLTAPPAALGFRAQPPPKSKQQQKQQPPPPPPPEDRPSPEDLCRHEIENGTHQLETLLCASIDKNFDILELWVMQNILTVRPDDRDWIRLSHYEGLDFSAANRRRRAREAAVVAAAAGEDSEKQKTDDGGGGGGGINDDDDDDDDPDAPTLKSIAHLRRRLQASQKLNVMLHAERARNAALLDELRALVLGAEAMVKVETDAATQQQHHAAPDATATEAATAAASSRPNLAFLGNKGELTVSDAETPLTTTAAFTLSQLQALRALSTSLGTMMPDLAKSIEGEAAVGQQKSWRTERLEYVESSTRKHLENVRGLELGPAGDVRDGEWQGAGRSLARGEVEGLEAVVGALGGDTGAGKGRVGRDGDEMDES